MNEPRFDPIAYENYRPLYPGETFQSLNSALRHSSKTPLRVLDLGCGTGAATESLLRSVSPEIFSTLEIHGIDPDAAMLEAARTRFKTIPEFATLSIEWSVGSAEAIPAADHSFDVLLIGSAFHWFHPEKSLSEITRVSKPGAHALLFEYQFPKALKNPALNEWAKRNFNQFWKAPRQTPRGSLKEISKAWRENPAWNFVSSAKPAMIHTLDPDAFFGHLSSQSRYLHYEAALPDSELTHYREETRKDLRSLYQGEKELAFDFYLSTFLLNKNK